MESASKRQRSRTPHTKMPSAQSDIDDGDSEKKRQGLGGDSAVTGRNCGSGGVREGGGVTAASVGSNAPSARLPPPGRNDAAADGCVCVRVGKPTRVEVGPQQPAEVKCMIPGDGTFYFT